MITYTSSELNARKRAFTNGMPQNKHMARLQLARTLRIARILSKDRRTQWAAFDLVGAFYAVRPFVKK